MKNRLFASVLAMITALMLICACAMAEVDYSALSDDALQASLDSIRTEQLRRRAASNGNVVLLDADGVTLYLTGSMDTWGYDSLYLSLEMVLINDSGQSLGISIDECYVNGWSVYAGGMSPIQTGKKEKANLDVGLSDSDVAEIQEIEEITLILRTYNGDTYSTLQEYDPITIYFDQGTILQ